VWAGCIAGTSAEFEPAERWVGDSAASAFGVSEAEAQFEIWNHCDLQVRFGQHGQHEPQNLLLEDLQSSQFAAEAEVAELK
jgi:hypothetical protein